MVSFTATIKRFGTQGEKTGWTYIEIPDDIANSLKKGYRQSFRVKGKIDAFSIKQVALLPMKGGGFILTLNSAIRKGIAKGIGAMVVVKITEDKAPFRFNKDFLECLKDEPVALSYFNSLPGSHQRYFSKWIDDAKTISTRAKRIAMAVNALARKKGYGEMLRNKLDN
jgi:hypothetical protein